MNCNFVPDFESSGATSKDNPFTGIRSSLLAKYQYNYWRMTGSVVSGKP